MEESQFLRQQIYYMAVQPEGQVAVQRVWCFLVQVRDGTVLMKYLIQKLPDNYLVIRAVQPVGKCFYQVEASTFPKMS